MHQKRPFEGSEKPLKVGRKPPQIRIFVASLNVIYLFSSGEGNRQIMKLSSVCVIVINGEYHADVN